VLLVSVVACGGDPGQGQGEAERVTGSEGSITRGTPLDAPAPQNLSPSDSASGGGGKTEEAIGAVAAGIGGLPSAGMGTISSDRTGEKVDGVQAISWSDLSMQDIAMEDILDSLLYPEEYKDGEFEFPDRIQRNDGEVVSIVGYMIPLEWKETTVPEFMLVRDLLGCCFGGSPQPDEWINVIMEGKGAEYFPYIPVIVTGTFKIEGIEDEAGYAAGCFHLSGTSVTKEL
jgi:hypothetical protein